MKQYIYTIYISYLTYIYLSLEKMLAILMTLVSFSQHPVRFGICHSHISTLKCLRIMCIITQYFIGIPMRMYYISLRSRYVLYLESRVSETA